MEVGINNNKKHKITNFRRIEINFFFITISPSFINQSGKRGKHIKYRQISTNINIFMQIVDKFSYIRLGKESLNQKKKEVDI